MTKRSTGTAQLDWIEKEFGSDVPAGKRALARALQGLCRHFADVDQSGIPTGKRPTQARAANRIFSNESSLSRFLSGDSVPSLRIIEELYRTACSDTGGEGRVGITLEELRNLRDRAQAERRCRNCAELVAELAEVTQRLREAKAEGSSLRQTSEHNAKELEALRDDVRMLTAAITELKATRAGLQARLAVHASSAPLPVPRRRGDRQRRKNDVAATRLVAKQAGELHSGGRRDAALSLLRHTSEVLSHPETATLLGLLRREQQDSLADNLIHIYGRDQNSQDILHVALELHKQGATDDAGALLRAALE
ncbi:hypothetical protein [Streptomyces sp. NPDC052036]|uniref:hypothetical protein n=1 Tax=Streptomyces sp. NPDC052036 TaxID=3155171 RepID=UPI003445AAB3